MSKKVQIMISFFIIHFALRTSWFVLVMQTVEPGRGMMVVPFRFQSMMMMIALSSNGLRGRTSTIRNY